jgi:hypothetical protein
MVTMQQWDVCASRRFVLATREGDPFISDNSWPYTENDPLAQGKRELLIIRDQ